VRARVQTRRYGREMRRLQRQDLVLTLVHFNGTKDEAVDVVRPVRL
jgi:hypothetical protein